MLKNIVLANRSYRIFYQNKSVSKEILLELVDLARLTPSARNNQPLKYFVSFDKETNCKIFPSLAWAGYLKDWDGPTEGERPSAYIVILEDTTIASGTHWDQGIAAQTIMLGAAEKGLGGCMIASVKREELSIALNIPKHLKIEIVLAIGVPKEKVVIDDIPNDGSIKYWRDPHQVHHVPKRRLDDIVISHNIQE